MDTKTEFDSSHYEGYLKKEEIYEKLEEGSQSYDEDSSLSDQSKKISKKRKKYQKIDNETRLKIVEEVQKNGKLLKNVSIFLTSFPNSILLDCRKIQCQLFFSQVYLSCLQKGR